MTKQPTLYEQKKMDLEHIIYGTRQEPVVSIEEIAKIIAERFDEAEIEALIKELKSKKETKL